MRIKETYKSLRLRSKHDDNKHSLHHKQSSPLNPALTNTHLVRAGAPLGLISVILIESFFFLIKV